jgi:hypothetical protein
MLNTSHFCAVLSDVDPGGGDIPTHIQTGPGALSANW